MTCSVRIHEFGGPEVLKIEDSRIPDPGPGEVRLAHRYLEAGQQVGKIVVTV
jgi:NADPH:quinone reductase-like Zn-dependent oxidoreductase